MDPWTFQVEKYASGRDIDSLKGFVESKRAGGDEKKKETHEKIPDPVKEEPKTDVRVSILR